MQRVLPLERGDRRLRPLGVLVFDQERPLLVSDAAQLVGDALLVQDQREVHRAAEIAGEAQEHAGKPTRRGPVIGEPGRADPRSAPSPASRSRGLD